MASRSIVSQVAEGRARRPFPYVGFSDHGSYRKDLHTRHLCELMDRLGFSEEMQKKMMDTDYSIYGRMNKKGGRRE